MPHTHMHAEHNGIRIMMSDVPLPFPSVLCEGMMIDRYIKIKKISFIIAV